MDRPRCIDGGVAGVDGPGTDLLGAAGEEGLEAEDPVRLVDDAPQPGFGEPELDQERVAVVAVEPRELGLEVAAYLDQARAFRPRQRRQRRHGGHRPRIGDRRDQVAFVHVGHVDDRLAGQQSIGLDRHLFRWRQRYLARRAPRLERGHDPVERGELRRELDAALLHALGDPLLALLHDREVRQRELGVDDFLVANRIDIPVDVDHVAREASHEMENGVDLADVAQELVPQHTLLTDRLGPVVSRKMTATEVLERSSEMTRLLGAMFGRLQAELLNPLLNRAVGILRRRGELPGLSLDGRTVELQSRAPLARIQAREDVRNVLLWLDTVTRLGPQASQVLNMGEAARWLAMMLGVPDELVREEDPLTALAGALAQQGTGNGRP